MKKAIVIVFLILTITVITITYGYNVNKQTYNNFKKTGYIITTDEDNYTTKYYFDENAKYKENYENIITFEDVNDTKVKVDNKNFVHYTDGSIGTLSKSVILNLEEINSAIIPYYNMSVDTILDSLNGRYTINNLKNKLSLTNFIIKISDSKYMVVSNDMILTLDEKQIKSSGYYEITYIEQDIIRIENQETTYQTISSNTNIKINNVTIDLNQKAIYYENERKLEFSQMVINSNDNVELTELPEAPTEEKEQPEKQTQEQTETEENINIDYGTIEEGTIGNTTQTENISGGTISGQTGETTETSQDYDEIPTFSVTELETTTNIVESNIQITDNSGLLVSDTTTKIIDNSTGKVVYMISTPNGVYNIPISVDNLTPDNNYTLISQAIYKKDNIEYKNDFVSKIFRTESLGLDITKDYFTMNSISLNIKASEYSNVQSFTVTLTDTNDETIKTLNIDKAEFTENIYNIGFDELNADTTYNVTLSNFMYEGLIMGSNYDLTYQFKTLKEKPTISDTIYTINKKTATFTLGLGNLKDPNSGVTSYRYEIYDATEITDDNVPDPVAIVNKEQLTSIDIKVDESTIYRGRPYVFKVVAEFNDNEKIIEYETGYSNTFQLDGVEYPSVSFKETSVTFERITGQIIISDPGNTMTLDNQNVMTVVYQNSVGITESFDYYGNLIIPFDKNNLRAGESYIISVYGTIDLQDGNGPVYCLIGSAVVNTPNTKPINVQSASALDVNSSFKVTAQLGTTNVDNTLEANTLTGLTFNLYAGSNTSGTLIKSLKKVDSDIEPYISNLKKDYYDNSFTITPGFFGLTNDDVRGSSYTIEITNGYDYTKYQNSIALTNNVITVSTNGVVPSLPQNIENAIETNVIRNKDTLSPRSDLKAETIVGYKIRANYDNSSKFLKYIKYYVYDADTDELLTPSGIQSDANSDGTINYVEIDLEDGIKDDENDTAIRRGKNYYFTYEAYLDLNGDNSVDTVYPKVIDSNVVLKSQTVSPLKQEPEILFFPSISTSNELTWKYNIQDIDNTIKNNEIKAYINDTLKDTQIIETGQTTYSTVTFSNLSKGVLKLKYDCTLLKDNTNEIDLVEQNFDGLYILPELTYHLNQDSNKISITINNYNENITAIKRIAALKVTFTTSTQTKTLDYLPLDNDRVTIDLTEISDLINQQISVSVSAYYDSGVSGFEITGEKAIAYTDVTESKYLALYEDRLFDNATATYSIFDTTFDLNNLNITSKIDNSTKKLPVTISRSGILYNYNGIITKKIEEKELPCDSTNTFSFDKLTPGVSLLNSQQQIDITTTLTEATFKIKVYSNTSYIADDKISIELYKTNETATQNEFVRKIDVALSELTTAYTIENLDPKTNYYVKLYANLNTNDGVEYSELYDVDFKVLGKIYYFKTLSKVGIEMSSIDMNFTSYQNKTIDFTYTMDNISGINTIEYKVYKYDVQDDEYILNETPIDVGLENDIVPTAIMSKTILCSPGSNIEYGTRYKIEIIPYALVDDELVRLDDNFSYDYTTPKPTRPFTSIRSSYSSSNITFKVSVLDSYKMIVDGKYKINVYEIVNDEKQDITPTGVANKDYSILSLRNTITISDVDVTENKQYELVVTAYIDPKNNIEPTELYTKSYKVNSQNFEGIYLGDVYTAKNNSNEALIDILFYNSSKLYEIDTVRYSIYSSNGYAKDNEMAFTPTINSDYYSITLPEVLETSDVYYIEMQFIKNDEVVRQLSIEYAYK